MYGEMKRGITVLKMRGSMHDKEIREFHIQSRRHADWRGVPRCHRHLLLFTAFRQCTEPFHTWLLHPIFIVC
jgi:hypothetical protein